MTITRANAEGMLVAATGPLLTAAGMAVTVIGSNADLNSPIGRAIRDLGYTVTDITSIVDADVAQVTDAQTDEFLDVATYQTLEAILGNLDDVDLTTGPRTEKFSQLVKQVNDKIARLLKRLDTLYGYGQTITAGVIKLQFAEHGPRE